MNINYRIWILLVFLTGVKPAVCQSGPSFLDELGKLVAHYEKAASYILDYHVKVYVDRDRGPEVFQEIKGRFQKQGSDYYSKYGDTEFLVVGDTSVVVEHRSKMIQYKILENGSKKMPDAPITDNLSDASASCDSSYVIQGTGTNRLVCVSFNSAAKTSVIEYKPGNYTLVKVEYLDKTDEFNNNYSIEIKYDDKGDGVVSSDKIANVSRFVIFKSGKALPANQFQGYTILKAE